MNVPTKVIASGLALLMGIVPLTDVAAFAAGASPSPELIKQQVDQYGLGANLKIRLADGKKLKGSLVTLNENGFELQTKGDALPRQVVYADVTEVKPAKLVYRAKGQTDAIEARRVVLGLGVGQHIQVRTTAGGKEIHGNIQSIAADSFTVLPDKQTTPVDISFSDVQYVEKNLSTGATIAIAAGVVAAVVIIILVKRYFVNE